MSGSLANRLVEAARQAVADCISTEPRDEAEAAVVGVLRQAVAELRAGFMDTDRSDYGKGWKDAYLQVCNDLELWAEVVERGEQQ